MLTYPAAFYRWACKNITLDWIANSVVFTSSVEIAFGYPFLGFWTLLFGNVIFIVYGKREGKSSFVWFNILYFINSINGIRNWWP